VKREKERKREIEREELAGCCCSSGGRGGDMSFPGVPWQRQGKVAAAVGSGEQDSKEEEEKKACAPAQIW
jgi:hypothetical protein